jgi:hypothetical protein
VETPAELLLSAQHRMLHLLLCLLKGPLRLQKLSGAHMIVVRAAQPVHYLSGKSPGIPCRLPALCLLFSACTLCGVHSGERELWHTGGATARSTAAYVLVVRTGV